MSVVSGGITNTLFKATPPSILKPVLIRVYGPYTEKLIDREIEVRRIQTLVQHGFGAEVSKQPLVPDRLI